MATIAKTPKKKQYRRGDAKYYADLASKSVASKISRHIECEVVTDLARDIPVRKRVTDAGYDISTPQKFAIANGERLTIDTGVRVKCPKGYFYELRGRSSLNTRGIEVVDNVIDATYTGEIRVVLVNNSGHRAEFKAGDRIAQLIFLPQIHVKFKKVQTFKVSPDDRGEAGFGSSGL